MLANFSCGDKPQSCQRRGLMIIYWKERFKVEGGCVIEEVPWTGFSGSMSISLAYPKPRC